MPKATKFSVNADDNVQGPVINPEPASSSEPPREIPSRSTGSVVTNQNITFTPINVSNLKSMLPSHFFVEPNYKIAGVNFTDGEAVGVVMGLGVVSVGGSSSVALYIRDGLERSHQSISLGDFKKSLGEYIGSARVVAIVSNQEWATVVGLRILKNDPRFGGSIGIALTLGSRHNISDIR